MDENKGNVGFINIGETGMFGNLTYNNEKYLVRNVTRHADGIHMTGMIQVESGETYLNKAGKLCKRYVEKGAIKFNKDSGTLILNIGGIDAKDGFTVSKNQGQKGEYLLLSFRQRSKYENMLDGDLSDVAELNPDSVPF